MLPHLIRLSHLTDLNGVPADLKAQARSLLQVKFLFCLPLPVVLTLTTTEHTV